MSCWDVSTGCLRTPYTGQVAWWLNPNHESRFVIFFVFFAAQPAEESRDASYGWLGSVRDGGLPWLHAWKIPALYLVNIHGSVASCPWPVVTATWCLLDFVLSVEPILCRQFAPQKPRSAVHYQSC